MKRSYFSFSRFAAFASLSSCPRADGCCSQYALDHSEKNPSPVRGTVIGKRRRGLDSNFTILNVRVPPARASALKSAWHASDALSPAPAPPAQAMDEEWYTATYTLSSPLLRAVKVMRRNHHSDGSFRRVNPRAEAR